ncbi:hypothetical protein HNQ51_002093 [Inhella inkyongensis]|uniref:2TM domain-containing protein n=1 Tax=Inhella inkyongensis TaxID=392593 RepID=A0A840S8P0_9BURK|nr:2TM domain-containing protein [Inhella inkyongensis]MBB5204779.1 hypothetical protein [Inhella inkyongensis]
MNTELNPDELQALAKKRVEMKLGFLTHLTVFLAVNGGLALLSVLRGGDFHAPFPLWGWGLGLAIHGLVTLLSLQGQGLRQRMMADELRALRERQA